MVSTQSCSRAHALAHTHSSTHTQPHSAHSLESCSTQNPTPHTASLNPQARSTCSSAFSYHRAPSPNRTSSSHTQSQPHPVSATHSASCTQCQLYSLSASHTQSQCQPHIVSVPATHSLIASHTQSQPHTVSATHSLSHTQSQPHAVSATHSASCTQCQPHSERSVRYIVGILSAIIIRYNPIKEVCWLIGYNSYWRYRMNAIRTRNRCAHCIIMTYVITYIAPVWYCLKRRMLIIIYLACVV